MRLLNRKQLRTILTRVLPLPNSPQAEDAVEVELPEVSEAIPAVKVRFRRVQASNSKGTITWRWAYVGPVPYIDDEMIIDAAQKSEIEPVKIGGGLIL